LRLERRAEARATIAMSRAMPAIPHRITTVSTYHKAFGGQESGQGVRRLHRRRLQGTRTLQLLASSS
jgi:hypothetical protein